MAHHPTFSSHPLTDDTIPPPPAQLSRPVSLNINSLRLTGNNSVDPTLQGVVESIGSGRMSDTNILEVRKPNLCTKERFTC